MAVSTDPASSLAPASGTAPSLATTSPIAARFARAARNTLMAAGLTTAFAGGMWAFALEGRGPNGAPQAGVSVVDSTTQDAPRLLTPADFTQPIDTTPERPAIAAPEILDEGVVVYGYTGHLSTAPLDSAARDGTPVRPGPRAARRVAR